MTDTAKRNPGWRSTEHRCCPTCTAALEDPLPVGTRVKIQRDEKTWPVQGSWPTYVGKVGSIEQVNLETMAVGNSRRGEQHSVKFHIEYGVPIIGIRVSWFVPHEITVL